MDPELLRFLYLGRLLAYMAVIYLLFGILVERFSRKEGSKLKAFAHLVCSPLTKPIGSLMPADTPYPRKLRYTLLAFGLIWLGFSFVTERFFLQG
jgi:hypothetical protein